MKKILVLALALLMVFPLFTTASAESPTELVPLCDQ